MKKIFLLILLGTFSSTLMASSLLEPLKTDHPRDTMTTFYQAMEDYREGLVRGDKKKIRRLNNAIRTLNLQDVPSLQKLEYGKNAAILLKEVIDRVIVLDFDRIPNDQTLPRWRLRDTEITISMIETGPRKGEFLFTPETVERAQEFYDIVRDLPYLKGAGMGAGYTSKWSPEEYFPQWGSKKFLKVEIWQWISLAFSILLGFLIKWIAEKFVSLVKNVTAGKSESIRHAMILAVEKPIGLLAATMFWIFSVYYLQFDGKSLEFLNVIVKILFGFAMVWAAFRLVNVVEIILDRITKKTASELDDQLVPLTVTTLKFLSIAFGSLMILQNIGINVMSLLAGLGLGGLAFALAAKDTAANLFGSIMILIDRPFRVGDWIKTDGVEGTVEDVGFRSTRVRTFYNSLISVPNSILATTNIDNMGQREFRRVRSYIGVTYDTPPEKIEAFIEGIKNIILANPTTRKDYYHVVFDSFGDSSLNIMLYFFLRVPDWAVELVEKQNIYLEVIRLAHELEIDFAFPTSTLHVETLPEPSPTIQRHQSWNEKMIRETASEFRSGGKLAKPRGLGIFRPPHQSQNNAEDS